MKWHTKHLIFPNKLNYPMDTYFFNFKINKLFTNHDITLFCFHPWFKINDFSDLHESFENNTKDIEKWNKTSPFVLNGQQIEMSYNSHGGNEFNLSTSHSNCKRLQCERQLQNDKLTSASHEGFIAKQYSLNSNLFLKGKLWNAIIEVTELNRTLTNS